MGIPAEASEIELFTPETLKNLPVPPVFKLRPASGRETREYRYTMRAEGLAYHSKEKLRSETLRAVAVLFTEEDAEKAASRLTSYWTAIDQGLAVDEAETAAAGDFIEMVTRKWKPLARLGADNIRFHEEALAIAVSMFVVGWSNFDLTYRREAGSMPLELVDQISEKLAEMEASAQADRVDGIEVPGLAFMQLALAAQRRMGLTEDEEKNSDSPPSSPSDRNGSTTTPSPPMEGAGSKASASSKQRRRASSGSKGGDGSPPASTASAT